MADTATELPKRSGASVRSSAVRGWAKVPRRSGPTPAATLVAYALAVRASVEGTKIGGLKVDRPVQEIEFLLRKSRRSSQQGFSALIEEGNWTAERRGGSWREAQVGEGVAWCKVPMVDPGLLDPMMAVTLIGVCSALQPINQPCDVDSTGVLKGYVSARRLAQDNQCCAKAVGQGLQRLNQLAGIEIDTAPGQKTWVKIDLWVWAVAYRSDQMVTQTEATNRATLDRQALRDELVGEARSTAPLPHQRSAAKPGAKRSPADKETKNLTTQAIANSTPVECKSEAEVKNRTRDQAKQQVPLLAETLTQAVSLTGIQPMLNGWNATVAAKKIIRTRPELGARLVAKGPEAVGQALATNLASHPGPGQLLDPSGFLAFRLDQAMAESKVTVIAPVVDRPMPVPPLVTAEPGYTGTIAQRHQDRKTAGLAKAREALQRQHPASSSPTG